MDEGDHTKEVYAHYGVAMYHAQCLERALSILLISEEMPEIKIKKLSDFDNSLDSLFTKTFGRLIKKFKKQQIDIYDDFENDISNALKKRNWVAHNYFWERVGHFATTDGRNYMVNELNEISIIFEELDKNITEITNEWYQKNGVKPESVKKYMEKIVNSAKM